MHCWFCEKVKGKRLCPAHGGDLICTRCCGTKRQVEIQCPEDCPYLHGEHDVHWTPASRRSEEERFFGYFSGITRERVPLLLFLHQVMLQVRRELGMSLSDADTLEVLATLSRTFETLAKGLLYEHQSDSPRLQMLIRRLGAILSERERIPGAPRASNAELAQVLSRMADAVRRHREDPKLSRSYLDTAERVFRPGLEEAGPLELPGEATPGPLIVEP